MGSAGALALLVLGYLLGSIPFGLILTRLAGLGDVRAIGSGNIGATNVLRTGRKDLAAATLVVDALKGTAAVLIGGMVRRRCRRSSPASAPSSATSFRSGSASRAARASPPISASLLGLYWPAALVFAVGLARRSPSSPAISSLAALVASLVTPSRSLFQRPGQTRPRSMALLAVLLWLKHRRNIRRLLAGTEGRIGQRQ